MSDSNYIKASSFLNGIGFKYSYSYNKCIYFKNKIGETIALFKENCMLLEVENC